MTWVGARKNTPLNRGAWQPVTSSIDWCETNYAVTYYVAEFFNSLSGLAMVLVACVLYRRCRRKNLAGSFKTLALSCAVVGVGSSLFHGLLKSWAQLLDELPMMLMVATAYFCLIPHRMEAIARKARLTAIALGAVYGVYHGIYMPVLPFQVLFGLLSLGLFVGPLAVLWRRDRVLFARHLRPLGVMLASFGLWVADQVYCEHVEALKLHALWHVGTAVSAYGMFRSLEQLRYRHIEGARALRDGKDA